MKRGQWLIAVLVVSLSHCVYGLSGSGTAEDPYRITSLADFDEFAGNSSYWNDFIRLEVDIDLAGRTYTTAVIAPDTDPSSSGFQGTKFTGSFDGNGKKIRNLRIDTAGAGNDYLSLFGRIYGSGVEVKNLGLENTVIIGGSTSYYLGSLCGYNYGTISRCYATGSMSGGSSLGGLCGGNSGTFSHCYAAVSVSGNDYLGGLCGGNSGTFSNCYATGQVAGGAVSVRIGGLCGGNSGTISNCYATGQVTGGSYSGALGGLCGYSENGTISDCYATGQVTGGAVSGLIGGLCGRNSYGTISNCYATGQVTGGTNSSYLGGLCGSNSGSVNGCFWDKEASGLTDGIGNQNPDPNGVMGLATAQMQTQSTFTDAGWDFVNVWYMPASDYPKLRSFYMLSGLGTAQDPRITSLMDFDEFAGNNSYWNDCIRLEVDIDLAGRTYTNAVIAPDTDLSTDWFQGTAFTGSFDGNGKTISNLRIDTTGAGNIYLGLFGCISGSSAQVNNLGLENAVIIGGTDSYSLGGLCGYNSEGTISDCYATGQVIGGTSSRYLGGLCGVNGYGTISNCYATSSVYGSSTLGGLCGSNSGPIRNCFASGPVFGISAFGGLCGDNTGTISHGYFYLFNGPDNHMGTALEAGQMVEQGNFTGFDFAGNAEDGTEEIWAITAGHCPKLSWQTGDGPLPPANVPATTLAGSGVSGDPFQINNMTDFTEFVTNNRLNCGYYVLTCDIDLSGQSFTTAVINRYFGGHLEGGGHKVANITIDTLGADTDYLGTFSRLCGSIYNLGIENIALTGGNSSVYLGGLCGVNDYGVISHCYAMGEVNSGNYSWHLGGLCGYNKNGTISSCYATDSVSGRYNLGGLCGYNYYGTIYNCSAIGSVSGGDSLGGLCGINYYGTISNCYTRGEVIGGTFSWDLGGLCGDNTSGTISNCSATGQVTGGTNSYLLGGLCGYNSGTICNCYATGSVYGSSTLGGLCGSNGGTIKKCYSTGPVSSIQDRGGFCGYNYSGSFAGCFWDTQTSGTTAGVGNQNPDPSGVTGLATAQMKTQSIFTGAGWDFVVETLKGQMDDWFMPAGDYPRLWWQNPLREDIDFSGVVDLGDVGKLSAEWLLAEGAIANYRLKCDFNRDGVVDFVDLAAVAGHWLISY